MLLNLRAVAILSFSRSTIDFEKVRDAILTISIDGTGLGWRRKYKPVTKNDFYFFGI